MQKFYCDCGQQVFYENSHCMRCSRTLGFDFSSLQLISLSACDGLLHQEATGRAFKYCQNQIDYQICNWLIAGDSPDLYCESCSLNEMVPSVKLPEKRKWWQSTEEAKRRLLYSLAKLGLPINNRKYNATGLGFAFMEDKRRNPNVSEVLVKTGHLNGLITINLAEADDAHRESTRVEMGELYRTLLGHFRHESGHYYFDLLVKNTDLLFGFREIFGDDQLNYTEALKDYYSRPRGNLNGYISNYAQAHPLEDWAECWAHYLHVVATLETAAAFGMTSADPYHQPLNEWLEDWSEVSVLLNELNRSMGLRDAYPFVHSEAVLRKLRFVHHVIHPTSTPN